MKACPAPYVENQFWTTEYGTASANIVLHETNFLACSSSTYALCYYSGPDAAPSGTLNQPLPSLPCKVSKENSKLADCRCYVEAGDSYVDIHSIRNTEAYIETVRACGLNGEKCSNLISTAADKATALAGKTPTPLPTAPVCDYLQANSDGAVPMAPDAELISTFSFAQITEYGNASNDCTSAAYAGCMTASCKFEVDENGNQTKFAQCRCPIYTGPFQIGQDRSCDAGDDNVWSAAYTPLAMNWGHP